MCASDADGSYVRSNNNGCGLNGDACRPFTDAGFPFRCRAGCAAMEISTPHAVGARDVNFAPLVIGGGMSNASVEPVYRADSFVCQAAIHAGAIADATGGCGVALLRGARADFPAAARHGIASTGVRTPFPKSYAFAPLPAGADCGVVDLRNALLAVTATFTAVLALVVSSPPLFVACVFPTLFLHVGLVSDPPHAPDELALVSLLVARFLPAAFILAVLYRYSARRTLADLAAPFDKAVLWVGGAWLGALDNRTFSHWIPIARLTPQDVGARPGGVTALVLIALLLFAVALGQAHCFRLEGRFRRMLALYLGIGAALLALTALPWLHLRLHHYVLAMLLLPGTSLQTRPSLLYQGILVGLFANGVARWGFASVLETGAALFGPGADDVRPPWPAVDALLRAGAWGRRLVLRWGLPLPAGWDGVSVLVNDVERGRWYADGGLGGPCFVWEREGNASWGGADYFRFAFMRGSETGPYTAAGVWEANGSWTKVPESLERW